jgi:Ser/Thr protein kinase RdoA (MazF antagonist)
MNDTVLNLAAQRYGTTAKALTAMPGGHVTHVYEFAREDKRFVLRVTPPNDEIDVPAMEAILAWMYHLSTNGVSVAGPLPSEQGKLVEQIEQEDGEYVVVALEKAKGVLAEELAAGQWTGELYRSLGQTVGKMHALSMDYVAPERTPRRPDWDQIGNCFNPVAVLDESQATIAAKKADILRTIRTLPKDRDSYGLAHLDLHFGNFYVDVASDTITLFDFDDCAYGWYMMDVAMPLFDVLVLCPDADKEAFAAHFLNHYLRGYIAAKHLSAFWLGQLPHFLKLVEIGVYTQVYRAYNPQDADSWIGRFMAGRRERIEHDVPYVNLRT